MKDNWLFNIGAQRIENGKLQTLKDATVIEYCLIKRMLEDDPDDSFLLSQLEKAKAKIKIIDKRNKSI